MGVVFSRDVPFVSKIELPLSLLGSIATNFTVLTASYTIVIALLCGIYIAFITYFLKRRIKEAKKSGITTGFLGIGSSVLGVGCAACGSLLLMSSVLSIGATSLLAYFPLKGSEFGILGVILLSISIYLVAKKIQNPVVCKVIL